MPAIHVDNLAKHYRVHHKAPGLLGSLRSLVRVPETSLLRIGSIAHVPRRRK